MWFLIDQIFIINCALQLKDQQSKHLENSFSDVLE